MTEVLEDEKVETKDDLLKKLVVFNDDYNTFQHVIDTLIRVLKMGLQQAEQCALLVHHKGRCTVKNGSYDELKPYRDAITQVGIDARIVEE